MNYSMEVEWSREEFENDFYTTVREFVIFFILFMVLQFLSFILISMYRKKTLLCCIDYEDAVAYKFSFWTCNFSLSITIGSALLLPMSIMSNEILLFYPDSYYIRWLNISLIKGLWNLAFLLSNFSIFILLPFAYFFNESQGFSSSYKGIRGRIYETICVLILVALLITGLVFIICAIVDYKKNTFVPIFNSWKDYFPFIYSCVSFLGVLLLLVCTPVGFAHLFTVVGKLVINKKGISHMQAEYLVLTYERANILVKLDGMENGALSSQKIKRMLKRDLQGLNKTLDEIDYALRGTRFRQTYAYPIAMMFLLVFTIILVLMVTQNILALCFGIKTLPMYSQNFALGINSLSALGSLGAFLEIIQILYLWWSSVVGLYALPLFHRIRPKFHETPMTHMIGNCVLLLMLSSALPVLARTIGITDFDLLGDFGRIRWLGNMHIVLFYNGVFTVSTIVCLGNKMTAACRELISVFHSVKIEESSPQLTPVKDNPALKCE